MAEQEILPPVPAVVDRDAGGRFAPGHGGAPGAGRPPGAATVTGREARQMILDALHMVGGANYLAMQAVLNPAVFCALVGKVVPVKVEGDGTPMMVVISQEIVDHRKP
jgi:hypothetical protein